MSTSLFAVGIAMLTGCVGAPGDQVQAPGLDREALASEPREVWRPFNDQSPWNTRIANTPRIDPQSDAMISDWRGSSPFGPHLGINMKSYSIPLFWADETTPPVKVHCDVGGMGFDSRDGTDATAMVPIPNGAEPDPLSDRHLLVVDRGNQREWGLWHANPAAGGWECGLGAEMDLAGDGQRPIAASNATWYTSQGPRACGFPLVAGLIRPEEIAAGHIDHALVVAYPHIRAGLYMLPASTAQARVGDDSIKTRGIPCGGRVQLDPKLDLERTKLSPGARVVARALQEYGAFVGDYSGSMSLYADNAPDALAAWDDLPISDVDKLELDSFRVLELGTLYDNGNGD
jgi:hypothetical protein